MVEYGNIVPNMAKIYLLKTGEVRDPLGLDNFHPNSNVNGIIVHIEGGSPSNIATMAFNPNIKNFLATHNFPLFYRGQVEHTVGNEAHPRTFSQYVGWVPNIVLALNVNKNTTMSVGVTVNQQSGIELLGAFRFITDLPNATQETDDCVAYVWEERENGYYQVSFNVLTQSYEWVKQSVGVNNHYNITTKSGIFTKQFNVFNITVQKGFANPNAITQLEDEQYRLIWQELAQLSAFIQQNTTLIGDLQEQIDELNLHVVKTITKQDTNTIAINLTRIPLLDNNNVEITAVVRVDSNDALNILEITEDGLLVDKTNVYDFIVEQFNDTNSDLHIAVLDLINDKLEEHNTSPTAHQDIREEVEQAIIGLDNNKLDKVWNNITSQTTTNLNDEFVLNSGGAVYKTTLANILSYVVPIDIFIIVSELPATGVPNKIYLVPSEDPELQNTLDEFIWINNTWERIGGISIDLILEEVNKLLEETTDKLVVDMEFNKDTNLLSLILENGDEISTIIDVVCYEPDNITIGLNAEQKLEVKDNLEIDGGFL